MNKEELITGMYMCDEDGNEWIDKKTYNCLYEEYTQLQHRINKAIEDLKRTLKFNKHYKDKYNEWVNVDLERFFMGAEFLNDDLQKEIERLKDDYRTTCEQKNKYIMTLEQGLNNAEQEIERLNNIINKAIEYIEDENIDITTIRFNDIQDVKKDLLEILKGEDNE